MDWPGFKTSDCIIFICNTHDKNWKRISKKKSGNQIIRVFQNRETEEIKTVYELNNTLSFSPLEPVSLKSHFSFFVKDGVTVDTFRINVGMGKEQQDESISLYEDNIGSHVPAVDHVMKQLGIEFELMENVFEGERHGKTNKQIKDFLISQGWYEDEFLNDEE